MSAQDTDVETQAKRHTPSLLGMGLAVAVAGILLLTFLFVVFTPETETVSDLPIAGQEELD